MSDQATDRVPGDIPGVMSDGETTHRLQLPRDTSVRTVVDMVHNTHPEATADGLRIDLGGEDGGGASLVQDSGFRGGGRWTLTTPKIRELQPPVDLPDDHGYARAFPEGIPFGRERELLDLGWSLARRLYGAVVTDSGVRIEPYPYAVRGLVVVSPNALVAEDLLDLVREVEPAAEADRVPAEADSVGYSVTIPVPGQSEDHLSNRVGPTSKPAALSAVPWLGEAADYSLVHELADRTEEGIEIPEGEVAERFQDAYRRIGRLAGVIVETVGGHVVDAEGYLVDPRHLL
jgi:tetrahydromethanopterin S-methyltransferase subunit G